MLEYELSRTYFAFLLFRPADKLPHQPTCGVSHRHCARARLAAVPHVEICSAQKHKVI